MWRFLIASCFVISVLSFMACSAIAQQGLVALWRFDETTEAWREVPRPSKIVRHTLYGGRLDKPQEISSERRKVSTVSESFSGTTGQLEGSYFKLLDGVSKKALQLDGNSSYVVVSRESAPRITGDFSVGAWFALGAYPTNWCPLADHGTATEKGYFLGIDGHGHAAFKIYGGGKRYEAQSEERIPLRKWTQITGVYSKDTEISLYINGEPAASTPVSGEFEPATDADLLIGRHSVMRRPQGTLNPDGTAEVYTFYDGLIDELAVFDRALSDAEVAAYVLEAQPQSGPPLERRVLPAGPPGSGEFGAVYTTLKYYDAWDALWRVGDKADVYVRFHTVPCRLVFWRGTSYIPHWVTENGIWYNNEFNETWSDKGCQEPMSDKRCQYSHVRVIENNPARVVVHWRYALVDNWYNMAYVDELTGWGDWTDEVYTVYPDMVCVREITLRTSNIHDPHQWHESIVVMSQGQRPEKVLEPGALTLANMKGESHTYSWRDGSPSEDGWAHFPEDANIHLVNTTSKYRPFAIVDPKTDPSIDIFDHNVRDAVSFFPWWNHWPTAQKPSDGRYALATDQASHCSLTHMYWDPYEVSETSITKLLLNGLTDKKADQLVPLTQSWLSAPELRLKHSSKTAFEYHGYDPTERAYQLTRTEQGVKLEFELLGTKDSPLVNPALVIENWGGRGVAVEQEEDCRIGKRSSDDGVDLIVWFRKESIKPETFTLISIDQ